MRRGLETALVAAAAFLAIAVSLSGLFEKDELPAGHDVWPHAVSAFEYARAIEQGVPWPRWLPDLCGGYGAPNPLYYSPLAHQLTGRLVTAGLSVPDALKAAAALAMLLSFLGMYVWARRSWGRAAGLLAATLYLFAPYHLLDLYLRFSYPELLGLAVAPWLCRLAQRAVEEERGERLVAALLGALAVAHNLSALLVGGFLVGYLGCLALEPERRAGVRRVVAALPLAAGLAAFFWMPALLDSWRVRISYEPSVHFTWMGHLLSLQRLLEGEWPGKREHLPLYPGRLHLALGAAGVLAACALARRGTRDARSWAAFGALSIATLGLMMPFAAPLWAATPLKVVQFPWRFLGPVALGMAWVAPAALWPLRAHSGLHAAACATGMLVVMANGFPRCRPEAWRPLALNAHMLRTSWQTADLDAQFVPITALYPVAYDRPLLELLDGHGIGKVVEAGPERYRARLNNADPVLLDVRLMCFDGWTAEVDGQPVPLELEEAFGGMRVRVPAGSHELVLRFGTTPLRTAAAGVSAATLVLMLVPAGLAGWRRWPAGAISGAAWLGLVAASIQVAAPLAWRAVPGAPDRHAHRARVALACRDHQGALAELALVDPAGPHGAWAAAQLAWHRAHGLDARYFSDTLWQQELLTRVEYALAYHAEFTPEQPFQSGAGSAIFTARFDVPADGGYDFAVDAGLRAALLIDQHVVVRELRRNQGYRAEGAAELTRGPHELAIFLRRGSGLLDYRFWWRPRGKPWELLPVDRLEPARFAWVEPLLGRMRAVP